jgi:hypothetical protein
MGNQQNDSLEGGFKNREFYSFARANFFFLTQKFKSAEAIAITEFSYSEELEKTPLYGAGLRPEALLDGNYIVTVKFTMYVEDYEQVIKKNIGTILNHEPFNMTIILSKRGGKVLLTETFQQIQLSKAERTMSKDDKGILVQLEGTALDGFGRTDKP